MTKQSDPLRPGQPGFQCVDSVGAVVGHPQRPRSWAEPLV
jgi:hypothetical protein